VRRHGPHPLAPAVERLTASLAPAGLLSDVQRVWRAAVGAVVAAEAEPVAERDGTVILACTSAVWAHELELLAPELLAQLNARLEGAPVRALRCRLARS
jgi:predicted nucleic acid-binding Zn ribbon protein